MKKLTIVMAFVTTALTGCVHDEFGRNGFDVFMGETLPAFNHKMAPVSIHRAASEGRYGDAKALILQDAIYRANHPED
jgi:hypothetical protein